MAEKVQFARTPFCCRILITKSGCQFGRQKSVSVMLLAKQKNKKYEYHHSWMTIISALVRCVMVYRKYQNFFWVLILVLFLPTSPSSSSPSSSFCVIHLLAGNFFVQPTCAFMHGLVTTRKVGSFLSRAVKETSSRTSMFAWVHIPTNISFVYMEAYDNGSSIVRA